MLTILNDLAEDDYFGIVLFDSSISTWKESLTKATKENVSEAQTFIQGITDSGSEPLCVEWEQGDIQRQIINDVSVVRTRIKTMTVQHLGKQYDKTE